MCACVFTAAGGNNVIESQSRIAHMCWSLRRGRWTKHPFIAAVTAVRREKLFTRVSMPFTTLSSHFFPPPSLPLICFLSLSLQEWVSNAPTGYHWYGARNRDDQTLWTCQQICQQHQQAAGCSGGEWGEIKKEMMLQLSKMFPFLTCVGTVLLILVFPF